MRPRYATPGIVLATTPIAEASSLIHLLTADFGLVRARAQGLRQPGAKLAHALQTFSECEAMLVRGKEGWRLSGALLRENFFTPLSFSARARAGRVSALVLRLTHGETREAESFTLMREYLKALPALSEEEADAAECLTALRILRLLGLDAGEMPGDVCSYDLETLGIVISDRREFVTRINRGITASGL